MILYRMPTISEWRTWILQQLISDGIHNVILEEKLHHEAGRHYDTKFELAMTSLMDEGIIMSLESKREKKYVVNFDKLDEAQNIINSEKIYKSPTIVQPYIAEPEGYIYWFENKDNRRFKKQSIYRVYFKKTDQMDFAAQLMTQSMASPKTLYMGTLNDSNSYISKLWRAASTIAGERNDGTFILQDLQDRERIACGNNRQRGKIALIIFRALGYIQAVETKGNSTKFKLGGKRPFAMTLDEVFNIMDNKKPSTDINL
ncbi:MAG: hypothetical protein M3297_10860 [Thermoproteota archaeon]|jgi:hypothetical protein|nr:hypothetical protein [Thermoproteota archaeon]